MKYLNDFTESNNIEFPLIMAPMFLVSNEKMIQAAIDNGILGVFPSLNFREPERLNEVIENLNRYKQEKPGNYGVNLIVQKTNVYFEKHLKICIDNKVPFYITSLGNPAKVIEAAHEYGAKVYCDVTNLEHAEKCYKLNCDGFIAVGQGAGGHAGPNPLHVLIPALQENFPDKPVIAAGGIATGKAMLSVMSLGAQGVSVGTRFIASQESDVNNAYKQAIVDAGMDDIVMTTKISGTPLSIINTEYAKKIGYEQNWLEKLLTKNPKTKKWFKMLVQYRGMKKIEQSLLPANYKTLWSAGKSVQEIHEIFTVKAIVEKFKEEFEASLNETCALKNNIKQ
ncbi:MAG: nitronate monooxygenase [Bacteroidetes bacterium]|nr:MAG: nitronate monooxygenase [Bacteroidota bacterium]